MVIVHKIVIRLLLKGGSFLDLYMFLVLVPFVQTGATVAFWNLKTKNYTFPSCQVIAAMTRQLLLATVIMLIGRIGIFGDEIWTRILQKTCIKPIDGSVKGPCGPKTGQKVVFQTPKPGLKGLSSPILLISE